MDQQQRIHVTSTEIIKPSSPTPGHRATFKLSLIDNHLRPFYSPVVFFYPSTDHTGSKPGHERIDILKSSLAHALTRFYPLAGRISRSGRDDSNQTGSIPIIHCNDEGVPFSVARVVDGGGSGNSLDLFLSRRLELDSFQQFLPFSASQLGATAADVESAPQVAVRATVFPCGGVAVGICTLHKIVDGHTSADFMKLWAAVARGSGSAPVGDKYAHDHAATWLFPARHGDGDDIVASSAAAEAGDQKTVTRRFVFDREAIYALKARSRSDPVPNPTRCEVVFGFIWKSVVNATARGKATTIHSVAGMTMDLRPRMKTPLPDYAVGNIFWFPPSIHDKKQHPHQSSSSSSDDDETTTLRQLVQRLRSSIQKVADPEFMKKLESGNGREEYTRNQEAWRDALLTKDKQCHVMKLSMSSVVGMGLYDDVDFGWGKPAWICLVRYGNQINNVVMLMDSPVGYGVEAWITLHEREMVLMENDPEFLTYAKNNPNLLIRNCLARL